MLISNEQSRVNVFFSQIRSFLLLSLVTTYHWGQAPLIGFSFLKEAPFDFIAIRRLFYFSIVSFGKISSIFFGGYESFYYICPHNRILILIHILSTTLYYNLKLVIS